MKIFICTDHDGFYPVGVASVIVAKDEKQAKKLLDKELKARKLNPSKKIPYTLISIDENIPYAHILNDGDY